MSHSSRSADGGPGGLLSARSLSGVHRHLTAILVALSAELHMRIVVRKGGTSGDDIFYASTNDDYIYQAKGGHDIVVTLDGNDRLFGEGGIDLLGGGKGDDILRGGGGYDNLKGEEGADKLFATPETTFSMAVWTKIFSPAVKVATYSYSSRTI